MNGAVYAAARRAGCSRAEAEVLAIYVEVDSAKPVAHKLGVSTHTVYQHLGRIKDKLQVAHIPAAVAKVMAHQAD